MVHGRSCAVPGKRSPCRGARFPASTPRACSGASSLTLYPRHLTVHILLKGDGIEHPLLIDVLGQRQLHQDAMH